MDIKDFMKKEGELPLDNLVTDGGLARIFRKVGCIGDSLSSGEFETFENGLSGYHDMYEYSWGQFMAREAGFEALNFSCGGLTASEFMNTYYKLWDCRNPKNHCQAYIVALGVNDLSPRRGLELGSIDDVSYSSPNLNKETFAGQYARIIQRLRSINPKSKFFLVSMPKTDDEAHNARAKAHRDYLKDLANLFGKGVFVIDLYEYAPIYDAEFKRNFYLRGHLNPQGYVLTAKMFLSYIDYIIRNNPEEFSTIPFWNAPFYND
jgi:lysophospholipase L1-like esterase